jgi:glycosyltransferase involved in cell wall biosynthesis
MAAPLYLWTLNTSVKRSACSYYRIETPMSQLPINAPAQVFAETGQSRDANLALLHADVAHFYAVTGAPFLHRFKALKNIKPAMRQGQPIYPPAIIFDHDDNNDFVHPFNTTYCQMGTRAYPDPKLLEPGDGMVIEDSAGNHIAEYIDKETYYEQHLFDVARNLLQMKVRHQIIREAHGVTAASPVLARYWKEVVGQPNTYFFPNTIIPEHFESIRAVRTDDSIRILWQGGMSHWIDWYPLRDALKTIATKYPNVKFVLFGEYFKWIHDVIPDNQIEHHFWVEYDAYKLKRGLLNCDINLCPLANNTFNVCKSAIKWYEGSIWDQPEATLAQNVGPYKEIQDGKTGLLFDTPAEFVEKLSLLIEDVALRARVAAGAREWVLANRTPAATIPGLFDFYAETRARQRRELGAPIIKTATLDEIKQVGTPLR